MARAIVVGAGVVGLTCAVRLLEDGHRVDVLARDLPRESTSAVAAALWYPYLALPREQVTAWAATSYAAFQELAGGPATGVAMRLGTEVFGERTSEPWWRSAVPSLDRETALPAGYADGWTFTAPVIDMPVHLDWLARRVADLGGTITRMNLSALPPAEAGGADVVVNCTGLAARHFATDTSVVPVRGQVVYVEQWGLDRWWLDAAGPTYVVPRGHEVVVGGTEQAGEWDRTPSAQTAAEILERATRLVPELGRARVIRHKVGLRPTRPSVRVERVGDVIHCYGHGGAGVTLSWGCAAEVAALVG